jgi:uncharacterized glyoxalase superfamily protein PhnB
MPIRYVEDMGGARRFYEALGLSFDYAQRPPRDGTSHWVEMRGTDGVLALHHTTRDGDSPGMELSLSFEADEPLEKVVDKLRAAGYEPATAIVDEAFGRSFTVRDPEGLLIQVNEHDRELHA